MTSLCNVSVYFKYAVRHGPSCRKLFIQQQKHYAVQLTRLFLFTNIVKYASWFSLLSCVYFCFSRDKDFLLKIQLTALQIRASQWSITANLWPLTAHIYYLMIIVTGDFSKKSYYCYYYFLEILLNDIELVSWNLNTYKTHRTKFFFICSVFTCCFLIIL